MFVDKPLGFTMLIPVLTWRHIWNMPAVHNKNTPECPGHADFRCFMVSDPHHFNIQDTPGLLKAIAGRIRSRRTVDATGVTHHSGQA